MFNPTTRRTEANRLAQSQIKHQSLLNVRPRCVMGVPEHSIKLYGLPYELVSAKATVYMAERVLELGI